MTDLTIPQAGTTGQEPENKKVDKALLDSGLGHGQSAVSEETLDQVFRQAVAAESKTEAQDPLDLTFLGGRIRDTFAPDSELPGPFEDAVSRLVFSYAESLKEPHVDTRGNVLREAVLDEDARLLLAMQAFDKYRQSDAGPDAIMRFVGGGEVPRNYLPMVGVSENREDREARLLAEWRVQAGRQDSPIYAMFKENVAGVAENAAFGAIDMVANLAVGVGNLFGADLPQVDSEQVIGETTGKTTRDELLAIRASQSAGTQVAQGAGRLLGTVLGFGAGPVARGLQVAGKASGAASAVAFGRIGLAHRAHLAKAFGHEIGVFASYDFLSAPEGERLERLASGILGGSIMASSKIATSAALRRLFSKPIKDLDPNEALTMARMKAWAAKHKVFQERSELDSTFNRRVVDLYIEHGLEGATGLAARKILGHAIKSGATATGFSAIDHEFRSEFLEAWGDPEKWESVGIKFLSNYLGSMALHVPFSKLVPLQRRSEIQPTGEPPPAFSRVRPEDRPQSVSADLSDVRGVDPMFRQSQVGGQPETTVLTRDYDYYFPNPNRPRGQMIDMGTLKPIPPVERQVHPATGTTLSEGKAAPPDLLAELLRRELGGKEPSFGGKPVSAATLREVIEAEVPAGVRDPATGTVMPEGQSGSTRRLTGDTEGPLAKQSIDGETLKVIRSELAEVDPSTGVRMVNGRIPEGQENKPQKFGDQKVNPSVLRTLMQGVADPWLVDRNLSRFGYDATADSPKPKIGRPKKADPKAAPAEPVKASKVSLVDTEFSFRVEGDIAYPNEAMRKALDLPESMPKDGLTRVLEVSGLMDALEGKARLPGEVIDAAGVHGEAGTGDAPGVVRRIALGQVLESKIGVPLSWAPPKAMKQRGKDALEPTQRFAVQQLRSLLNQAEGLSPEDRGLLSRAIEVLDTVSAAKDPAVRETMDALPDLLKAAMTNPSGAIKALAESLTVKHPDVAMRDMLRSEETAIDPQLREERAIERETAERLAREDAILDAPVLEAEVKRVRALSREVKNADEAGFILNPASAAREALANLNPVLAFVKGIYNYVQRDQIQRVRDLGMSEQADVGAAGVTKAKEFQANMDRAGLFDLARLSPRERATLEELVPDGHGGFADLLSRAVDAGVAKMFGEAGGLTAVQQKVVDLVRGVIYAGAQNAESINVMTTDKAGKNPKKFTADKDQRILPFILTPEVAYQIRRGQGEVYEALLRWIEATHGWSYDEAKRNFTDASSLIRLDHTEVRRQVKALPTYLEVNGKKHRILETEPLQYAMALAATSSNVLGARSVLGRFEGKVEQKGLDVTAPDIMGRLPKTERTSEAKEEYQAPAHDEVLPPSARSFVNEVYNQKGVGKADRLQRAEAVYRMVRAMHGLQPQGTAGVLGRLLPERGAPGYRFIEFLGALASVPKAALLTMSFPVNFAEPTANTPLFGHQAVANGYKDVLQALSTGRFAEMHREAVVDGYLADTKANGPWRGDTTVEVLTNFTRKASDLIYSPMRMSQDFAELVNYSAARQRLEAMKRGEGIYADRSALETLGFDRPTIDAMLAGRGTEAQYARYMRNIAGKLAGGKSLRSAEKSDAAHSAMFNSLVWYTNFFQARMRIATSLVRSVLESKGGAQKAESFANLGHFLAMNAAAGVVGTGLRKWMVGGSDEMLQYYHENLMAGDATDTVSSIVGFMADSVLGGQGRVISDSLRRVYTVDEPALWIGETAQNMLGPVQPITELGRFIGALAGAEVRGYENQDLLGMTGVYLRRAMPAAKAVHEGLFGLSVIGLTEKNENLDRALDSYWRWRQKNKPANFGGGDEQGAEWRQWREKTRGLVEKVMENKSFRDQDFIDALIEAEAAGVKKIAERSRRRRANTGEAVPSLVEAYKEARSSVASFLRRRMILSETSDWSPEEKQSLVRHLGDGNYEMLLRYDAVLEAMATKIRGIDLIGPVVQRARQ